MQADKDDMPEYLRSRKQEGPWKLIAIMGVGTAIVWSGISLFGSGFAERAKMIASGQNIQEGIGLLKQQPKQKEVHKTITDPLENKNPLESLNSSDNSLIISKSQAVTRIDAKQEKQTVFNNQNYQPKGAINIVDARAWGTAEPYEETRKRQEQKKIVVVGEQKKPGDWVCSYFGGEGSVDKRNCKSSMQLHKRNQSYTGNRTP